MADKRPNFKFTLIVFGVAYFFIFFRRMSKRIYTGESRTQMWRRRKAEEKCDEEHCNCEFHETEDSDASCSCEFHEEAKSAKCSCEHHTAGAINEMGTSLSSSESGGSTSESTQTIWTGNSNVGNASCYCSGSCWVIPR